MQQKFLTVLFSAFLAHFAFLAPLHAASAVGNVIKAQGSAIATGTQGKRKIGKGSSVFQSDTIRTGFSDAVHILFRDKTKLTVGPRSQIRISSFVPASKGRVSKFAIRAARGTFRFITGHSRKSAYSISTKTATIGIRGTGFDFAIKNSTSVLLYVGSVKVCSGSKCTILRNKCDLSVQTNGGMRKTSSANLPPNAFRLTFPYVSRENRLPKSFRLGTADCESAPSGGPEAEGNDHGDTGDNGY